MINWTKSAELNNITVDDLKSWFEKYPESHKKIIAICDNVVCARERIVSFRDYRSLCYVCCARNIATINFSGIRISGKEHWNWKGGITSEHKNFFNLKEYKEWRISVFKRDNYTCQECNKRGGDLNSHHLLPYRDWKEPEYSLNIDNGITLCLNCHKKTYQKEYEFFSKYFDIIHGINI